MFALMSHFHRRTDGVRADQAGCPGASGSDRTRKVPWTGFRSAALLPGGRTGRFVAFTIGLLANSLQAAVPAADDGAVTVLPGESVTFVLAATDADGDTLDYIMVSPLPTLGTVKVGGIELGADDLPYTIPNHGKTMTFIAGATAHGTAEVVFKANDGTNDSAEATMTVNVNRPPVAGAVTTFFTTPSTDLKLVLPAVDPDDDKLSYMIESLPGHGRIKIGSLFLGDTDTPYSVAAANVTYVPDPNFHGQDAFLFSASDGQASSTSIVVRIEVNTTPVPAAIGATVLPNGLTTITLSATDADKDPIVYVIASLPAHGTLLAGGTAISETDLPFDLPAGIQTLDFQVVAGYRGSDTFHYRAKDSVSISGRAVVTVLVNTPPVAPTTTYAAAAGAIVEGKLLPTDKDGDALTLKITQLGTGGSLKLDGKAVSKAGTSYNVPAAGLPFTYTLNSTFTGRDSLTWIASDGIQESAPGEVVIYVEPAAGDPADTPTPEPPPSADDPAPTNDLPAPASCAPLGSGVFMATVAWGVIIGPWSPGYRRMLARRRV